jgi:hypothetical protein
MEFQQSWYYYIPMKVGSLGPLDDVDMDEGGVVGSLLHRVLSKFLVLSFGDNNSRTTL